MLKQFKDFEQLFEVVVFIELTLYFRINLYKFSNKYSVLGRPKLSLHSFENNFRSILFVKKTYSCINAKTSDDAFNYWCFNLFLSWEILTRCDNFLLVARIFLLIVKIFTLCKNFLPIVRNFYPSWRFLTCCENFLPKTTPRNLSPIPGLKFSKLAKRKKYSLQKL